MPSWVRRFEKGVDTVYSAKPVAYVRNNFGYKPGGNRLQNAFALTPLQAGTRVIGEGGEAAGRLAPRLVRSAGTPGGVRSVAGQAGEDALRALERGPELPAAGRAGTKQFPHAPPASSGGVGKIPTWAKTTALVSGSIGAGVIAINRTFPSGNGADGAPGTQGPQGPFGRVGDDLANFLGDFGAGLANLFASSAAGAGAGLGAGAYNTLAGVGEGLKKVALPAALIGAGFLVFQAVKKK